MKAPREGTTGAWERSVSRFLTANGIPLTWKGHLTGFVGIAGYTFRRITTQRSHAISTTTWSRMPEFWKEHRDERNLIVIVTNRKYGSDLEDSLVVMRLGTFAPIFKSHIDSDRERWIRDAT